MKTSYHVENGHTLLYRQANDQFYGILAGKPQLGGRDWKDGICAPDEKNLRPATISDFDFFRVCHKGHLT